MKKIWSLLYILLNTAAVFAQKENTYEKILTILYTNDLHAHLEPQKIGWISENRTIGGFANIASLVKTEKQNNPNAVYFDAGDYFTGPYISSLTKGEAVIDVMNQLSIDAACIGNHEFDHGWQNVVDQISKATFPILNGNIFIKNSNKLLWNHPYKIIIKNGIRIGVIGLHGEFAFYDTISEEMIQGVEARDEEKYLQQYINELSDKTDLIVLLIHQGIPGRQSSKGTTDVNRNLQKDIELASKVKGLDIIVTGHAHQGTPEALVSNGTLIVSTDALGMELGRLDLVYNSKTDKIVSHKNKLSYIYDDEVPNDSSTQIVINKWKDKLKTITEEKVCIISKSLTRSYGEESSLGNMVTDAMIHSYPDNDFAITNSGGLRQDIDAGNVTVGNLISAFPFPNTVVKVELKGAAIRKLFEHAASLSNGILQVSKQVVFVYSEKNPKGSKVISIHINGKPLDDNKIYKVLTNNFLADGGDGYTEFKNAITKKNTQEVLLENMKKYLKTFSVYTPILEGRIVVKQK